MSATAVTTNPSMETTAVTSSSGSTSQGPDGIFIDGGMGTGVTLECNLVHQNCPPGEKCMPWTNDGGTVWNATRCSPVADDPGVPGEPCTVEVSSASGIDTCDVGVVCFGVDPRTLQGTCVALCVGSEASPTCEDPEASCRGGADAFVNLCYPACDPLLQDCGQGLACYPKGNGVGFECSIEAASSMPGEGCNADEECAAGAICAQALLVPDCGGGSPCCTALCDLTDPMPPCLLGQVCMPWYEPGMALPGQQDVGVCMRPA